MKERMRRFVLPIGCVTFLLASCATIPSEFTKQVDQDLTFADAKRAPERFRGKIFLLGGTVRERTDLPDMTQMRIHEHQVDTQYRPHISAPSEGEFLVVIRPPVNPAQYPAGKPVTVVGKLTGVAPATGRDPLPSFDALYLRSWEPSSPSSLGTSPSCQTIIGTGC
jgi:outer membrane lipoprotein